MNIIDTHAHLDHIENIDEALDNAGQAGVNGIVTVSVSEQSCRKNLDIQRSRKTPKIYLAFGMHPSDADLNLLDNCVQLIREEKASLTAGGEIGLDFWYKWVRKDQEKKDEQRKIFRTLLELACELSLPAVIHTRGTWREAFQTAHEVGIKKAEFHWYSGPIDVLKDILDSGYFVSASPSLAYSPQSREAINYAPIAQTMIETDSPVFYRNRDSNDEGFVAQPKDVIRTLKAYSKLKKIDEDTALNIFNNNAREFFHLA